MSGGPTEPSDGVDRRRLLKRAAAAGAIAWTAPVVLSDRVSAQVGTCTPKCVPQSAGTATAIASISCTGNGNNRVVIVTVQLTAQPSYSCLCGGTATVTGRTVTVNRGTLTVAGGANTFVVNLGRGSPGVLDVFVNESVTCVDRSGDNCTRSCTTTLGTTVGVQDQGNCNGAFVSPPVETTVCS